LLDDGKVRLIAEETSPERAVTRVVIGRQDVGPQGRQPGPTPTCRYRRMDTEGPGPTLEAALVTGIDWVALSFVQARRGTSMKPRR